MIGAIFGALFMMLVLTGFYCFLGFLLSDVFLWGWPNYLQKQIRHVLFWPYYMGRLLLQTFKTEAGKFRW